MILVLASIGRGFMWVIIGLFTVIEFIVRTIANFFSDALMFVMSEEFVTWSYTTRDNPVIDAGLSVTVSIVNIIIIFALVVIAGGIMLGIEKYGTKKMLLNLILIALLVNFAPLLVGVVVDASNILMYFFMEEAQNSMNYVINRMNEAPDTASGLKQEDEFRQDVMARLAVVVMQTVVYFILGFVFFLYTLLFIFRYIAIWMLTILSPIAFASLAHPLLNDWWKKWWAQLISWSFVGVFAGFYLWLSLRVNERISDLYISGSMTTSAEGFATNITSHIFPMFVVVAFFVMGFYLSVKTAAMGADKIVNFAQERRKWVQKQAYRPVGYGKEKAVDYGKEKVERAGRRTSSFVVNRPFVKEKAEKLAAMERWGEQESGISGWAKRRVAVVQKPFRAAGRNMASKIDSNEKALIENYQEKYKNVTDDKELASLYKGSANERERYAIYKQARESGKLDKFTKETGDVFRKDFNKSYEISKKTGDDKNFRKALPMEYISTIRTDTSLSEEDKNKKIAEESDKLMKEIGGNTEDVKVAAQSITSKAKDGDKAAQKMIRDLLKRKVENLNTLIESTEDGMVAIDKTFEKYYEDHKKTFEDHYGSNLTKNQKKYVTIDAISPQAARIIDRGPVQLMFDIEKPEEVEEEATESKTTIPGEDSWRRRYKK